MKTLITVIFLIAALPMLADTLSDYRLGSGDSIKISVYEEPELALEVRLNDAATISYPFLGEIQVSGLTVGQLENSITTGLKGDYLVNPDVTVSVAEYRPFYIHGEVESPGGFSYLPGLTLRKAIALAGGFTERASRSKMFVIRDGVAHETQLGRQINLDEELSPGDIVTIEQSFF
jgi:polysaccharide biosynthesis/export protein VpsN